MKSGVAATSCFLILLIFICPLYQQILAKKREKLLAVTHMGYYMPSKLSGPASLDFKGIISDFLYLKMSTFIGAEIIAKKNLKQNHAEHIFQAVDIITDLDPWFWDAYLIGDMILAWDFKRIDLANRLLLKAIEHRTWDFKPFYYLGFNYFYFLKDNDNGAQYLMEASKRPGGPSYLPALATRLATYQNKFDPAIIFLDDLIKSTQNPALKKQFKVRQKTMLILRSLEKKVDEFNAAYGYSPPPNNRLGFQRVYRKNTR